MYFEEEAKNVGKFTSEKSEIMCTLLKKHYQKLNRGNKNSMRDMNS